MNNSNYFEKTGSININNLVLELEKNGTEKNKEDFIKNYAKLKEQIEQVDNILTDAQIQDSLINKFSKMDIKELFDILESNSHYTNDFQNLDLEKFKTLLVVVNVLEEKLNCESINIIESK